MSGPTRHRCRAPQPLSLTRHRHRLPRYFSSHRSPLLPQDHRQALPTPRCCSPLAATANQRFASRSRMCRWWNSALKLSSGIERVARPKLAPHPNTQSSLHRVRWVQCGLPSTSSMWWTRWWRSVWTRFSFRQHCLWMNRETIPRAGWEVKRPTRLPSELPL